MRRLSGQDSGFLSLELAEQPMQTLILALLAPGPSGPLTTEDLAAHIAGRLDVLPAFRRRIVGVPWGVSHPIAVEDRGFDLAAHVHHAVLPAPGGDAELDRFCAGLVAERLDRGRALWRATLVDGLAGGRQALALEIHHALMDGFATLTSLERLFGEAGPLDPGSAGRGPWRPDRVPGGLRRLVAGAWYQAGSLARFPKLVSLTNRRLAAAKELRTSSGLAVPQAGVDVPVSSINQGFTPERRLARASLPLADVKLVKAAGGVTVNDVALAVVAGALRAYLLKRGALPESPLVASVPVGMEGPAAAPRAEGNRFSRIVTSLATDVADPWERLQRISAVTKVAKECLDVTGPELLCEWLEHAPPILAVPGVRRGQEARRNANGKRSPKLDVNVVISNVRGPASRWHLGGAEIEEMYLAGPPNSGAGATFVLWDYAGTLLFAILAFADSIDDPTELATGLATSLAELVASTPPPGPAAPGPPSGRTSPAG